MTAILAYTPMVSAQVRAQTANGYKYYDLTDDITDFSVTLNTDGCSTFSLTLQNVGGKYDGAFKPMDAIAIYLSKANRYQVLAGYVTKVPMFMLNSQPVTITGKDVLWRLQALYWDSGLLASRELVTFQSAESSDQDGGYWRAAANVLMSVAGWPAERISVGQIPTEVIEWALSMYDARLADTQGADMVNQIYSMLQVSGPTFTAATGDIGGLGGDVFDGDVTEAQKKIVEVAKNSERYGITTQGGFCQKWVDDVFDAAGIKIPRKSSAREAARAWGASTDWSKVKVGAAVFGYGWDNSGNPGCVYGHVGIYVGNGVVLDNIGYVHEWSLTEWVNSGNTYVPQGTGWGWNGGVILDEAYPCRPGLLP